MERTRECRKKVQLIFFLNLRNVGCAIDKKEHGQWMEYGDGSGKHFEIQKLYSFGHQNKDNNLGGNVLLVEGIILEKRRKNETHVILDLWVMVNVNMNVV